MLRFLKVVGKCEGWPDSVGDKADERLRIPGAAPALQVLMDTAMDCRRNRLVEAIEKCIFIIDQIKFLKCYDKTDNLQTALSLMNLCVFSICDDNESACKDVKWLIIESSCKSRIKRAGETIVGQRCPQR
ncbi:hypothetical protein ElyMa_004478000 [Elysia marginata]|uniref:WAPL domain-containing protein n=1 Tax=Elysia marginata TaxID=1093978 RepID=A0AAV4HHL5_9GAST|nr:hypothetical protein ElyMa_004478000 [Elysia marginata]